MKSTVLFVTALLFAGVSYAGETNKMVVQGYLKAGNTAVSGSYRMGFAVKKNGVSIYCYQTSASAVAVAAGVFNYTLRNSNPSSCGGSGLSAELANVDFGVDDVTVDVVVDMENNGIGTGTDASFTNLDIVAAPFALVARLAQTVPAASLTDAQLSPSAGIAVAKISGLGALATLNSVTTSQITDGTITNADISASAAISGSKLQAAGSGNAGAVTTGAQTFSGAKTFNSGVVIGSGGTVVTSVLSGSLAAANYTGVRYTAPQTANVSVAGAAVGDIASCSPDVAPPANGFGWSAMVTAADTVRIYITNTNTAAVSWNSVAWKCIVTKI